jgi:hypothetical protein
MWRLTVEPPPLSIKAAQSGAQFSDATKFTDTGQDQPIIAGDESFSLDQPNFASQLFQFFQL